MLLFPRRNNYWNFDEDFFSELSVYNESLCYKIWSALTFIFADVSSIISSFTWRKKTGCVETFHPFDKYITPPT